MTNFASSDRPLRASYLVWVARCNLKTMLDLFEPEEEGGAAAQNGSATHAGIAAFHQHKGDHAERVAAAFAALRGSLPRFPLADYDECRLFLTPYCVDPRNTNAAIVAVEQPVKFTIPPHPIDRTREPIHVQGTLDQIRAEGGKLLVWDAKTGQPTGLQMMHDHAYQLAAYTLGARQCGFPTAEPGGLIRLRRYRERTAELPSPSGIYWHMPFSAADCEMLLDQVRMNVALIRMGYVNFGPGIHCTYCPHKGLDGCIPKAKQKLGISLAL